MENLREQSENRQQEISDNYTRTRNVIIGALVASMVLQIYVWWVVQGPVRPGPPLMEFRDAYVTGPDALCPGETLTYDIVLRISGPGVYHIDVSVWQVEPGQVVGFSRDARSVVFTEPAEYTQHRAWTVPQTMDDPEWNLPVSWTPGLYERRHAISTASRSTDPSLVAIPFQIRQGCP